MSRIACSASRLATGSGGVPKRSVSSASHVAELREALRPRDAPVRVDLGGLVGDVLRRHVRGHRHLDAHRRRDRGLLALQLVHRLLQHLRVHLEADRRDVAALLVAQQVAGAADLQVAHGDLEAGAQLGVVGQRLQARRRLGREQLLVG